MGTPKSSTYRWHFPFLNHPAMGVAPFIETSISGYDHDHGYLYYPPENKTWISMIRDSTIHIF